MNVPISEDQKKRVPFGGAGEKGGKILASAERAKDKRSVMVRLWGYLSSQGRKLLLVVFLVAAATGFELLGPYLMGVAIDKYIATGNLRGLAFIVCIMILAYIMGSGITLVQSLIMAEVSQDTVRHLRKDLFSHLQTLSLRFFDQSSHGNLLSRFSNDVENISNVLNEGAAQFIAGVLMIASVTVVMFMMDMKMALVTISVMPFVFLLTKWIAARTRKGYRMQQQSLGILNGVIEETVVGQRVVKAYCKEHDVIQSFDRLNLDYRDSAVKAQTYMTVFGPIFGFLNNMNFAMVACAGGYFALKGSLTVGSVAVFLSYSRQFFRPVTQISAMYNSIQSALAGAERVFEVMGEEPEIVDIPDAQPLTNIRGDVIFEHVTFAYEKGNPVLKDISLHASPGETIALVGPTGAGKTTIINLLTRFYDIESGNIYVDGQRIDQIQKNSLRRQLGIVLQETFLFSDTVMENIRYGKLEATDEEVIAAAELSGASSFINRLPKNYETPLAEKGSNLSHGQRQLLSIARAILADPSILILDEATSSVDTRTEINIQTALLKLMEGRTSFVIAHRLSTIRGADNVIVIDKGEIVEQGTHIELLAKKGFYSRLYMSQFKGRSISDL
ncbi:multidrug ABC transporter ATP-binding protein [Desulfobacter hydrogenophilus]|uniref:ABC transporter ATP-binding protein n=1 Tax=Desulfobacter hydrogenophilus TaxID=2291 RepID=A0A328FEI2_9BACT|nr:ABC transporter ATP-binding protein [Desulfobacter hydrogenophilus]NDY72399.1 ABC transporter ATP-binding protein [Desulfobacter hydrogenophilus]QBH13125.1 ABC transporter ATP-binding protein [Desulfobacter hydrogenophilus]RAM01832.1 multidrug ABC transporter ATP-binding protein [Desulfobacter hydrogenophilus]